MTRRPLARPTIVGLTVICLGLGWNALASEPPPVDGGDPGRLEISSVDVATGTRAAILSASDMVPGDVRTSPVTVANSGREPMSYTMSRGFVSADGAALSEALILTIRTIGSSCADFDGTILFDGPLDEATIGSGDDARPLAAATAEILCFRAMLPLGADNRYQGAAGTVTLTFDATWVAAR
jgi:hypothetical protein